MANVTLLCFLLLAVGHISVTSSLTIDNLGELTEVEFGRPYPRHGFYLLYWFCHDYISFDNNDMMIPKTPPQDGAYGFHEYKNWENLLPSLTDHQGYAYYVVGNLLDNRRSNENLPSYVSKEFCNSRNSNQNNRDRIIVRRTPQGSIDQVYITQHYEYGRGTSAYDPNNTYHISKNLIKDIKNIPRYWYFLFFDLE